MNKKISTRQGFGIGICELASTRKDIIVTAADTYRSFAMNDFVNTFTERYFEFGIAEQNMMMASAAIASEGKTVFTVGYSPFLSMRALEQMRTFIGYPDLDVKIVAGLSGLSGDTDGVTHQGTEDISIVRSLPNFTLLCPADAIAAEKMVTLAAETKGPVYLRLGRGATPVIYEKDQQFEVGKAITVRDYGNDFTVIGAGVCVTEAVVAAEKLNEQGINIRVIDMHTIKPLDETAIIKAAEDTGGIITVEDGAIFGGLGGAVAEVLAEKHPAKSFKRLGLKTYGTAGDVPELLEFFGLDSKAIISEVKNLI
jgi:transketolase